MANYAILLYWLRWCSATAVPGSRPVIFTAPRRAYRTASAQSALASDGHVRARCPDLCAFGCTPACVGDACGKHACLIRLFAVPPPLQHILARFDASRNLRIEMCTEMAIDMFQMSHRHVLHTCANNLTVGKWTKNTHKAMHTSVQ